MRLPHKAIMMIYQARYVLPMDGGIIDNGEVMVDDGRIAAVGTGLDEQHPDEPVRDLGCCALLPGFVNAHSHIEYTMARSRVDGLNLWDWINAVGYRRGQVPPYEALVGSALLGAARCACSGITCLGDSSFSGAAADAIEALGLRGVVYLELFGQSMGDNYVQDFAAKLDTASNRQADASSRLTFGLSPHTIYTSNAEVLKLCAQACTDADTPIALHLAETEAEAEYSMHGTGPIADWRASLGYEPMVSGLRPARYLLDLGLLRKGVCLAHCVDISDDEIDLISKSGASVAHCPRSNAYLGTGIAPLQGFLTAGACVGIGTDSAASCLTLDFFEEMRFALGLARANAKDAGALTAKEVLRLATAGGAEALGLSDRIGTLEPGKRADMVAVDLTEMMPEEDIHLAILLRRPGDVKLTLVDGVEIVRDGSLMEHRNIG
ncbi:MAG: amidohydrolase family protein [Armatimonadetes bacterium]|nr:amidohydrolase family protein [Armatimonadota bacterium]